MRKIIIMVLTIALITAAVFTGCAAKTETKGELTITGIVSEINTDAENPYIMVISADKEAETLPELMAYITPDTILLDKESGKAFKLDALQVGMTVSVYTNGAVTMSLPAQSTATTLVLNDKTISEVPASENAVPTFEDEQAATADTQNAEVFTIKGKVELAETDESGFPMLTIAAEEGSESLYEKMVILVTADTVVDESGTTYGVANSKFVEGESVTVYTNGAATRSIPPQATATKLLLNTAPAI